MVRAALARAAPSRARRARPAPGRALSIGGLEIPASAFTLEGFRRWVAGLDEGAPLVTFYRGWVHVEMTPQSYRTHGPLADAINEGLRRLTRELDLGMYFVAPSWLTDRSAGLSTEPDGFLVRWESFASGRVRINPNRDTELVGAPDLALEVLSPTSVEKDLLRLREAYARGRVPEYWVADALGEQHDVDLQVHVLRRGRYQRRRADREGWVASPTFGRSFCVESFTNRAGLTDYRLLVR